MRLLVLNIQAEYIYHELGDDLYGKWDENRIKALTVPWLRRLIANLTPRRPGFDTASFTLRFVVEKLALVGSTENTSVFPCHYHSTDAQHSLSTP